VESVRLFRSFGSDIGFALPRGRAALRIVSPTSIIAAADSAGPLVLKLIFHGLTTRGPCAPSAGASACSPRSP
jgi:hypothetical protein